MINIKRKLILQSLLWIFDKSCVDGIANILLLWQGCSPFFILCCRKGWWKLSVKLSRVQISQNILLQKIFIKYHLYIYWMAHRIIKWTFANWLKLNAAFWYLAQSNRITPFRGVFITAVEFYISLPFFNHHLLFTSFLSVANFEFYISLKTSHHRHPLFSLYYFQLGQNYKLEQQYFQYINPQILASSGHFFTDSLSTQFLFLNLPKKTTFLFFQFWFSFSTESR